MMRWMFHSSPVLKVVHVVGKYESSNPLRNFYKTATVWSKCVVSSPTFHHGFRGTNQFNFKLVNPMKSP